MQNGPLWLTVSALLFAAMAVMVRVSGIRGIPGSESTVIRFLFGLATVAVLHKSGVAPVRVHQRWLWVSRGVLGGVAILFYFLSLSAAKGKGATPLTNSVFLGNSYFVFAPIFARIFIRERLCRGVIAAIMTALLGLYFVAQPEIRGVTMGDFYGFLAGLLGGLALVTVRELRRTESAVTIFSSLSVFGALAGLVGMLAEKAVLPDLIGWALLIGMGISSTAAQLLLTYSLRYTRVGPAGLIQMTTVVYSSLAGILWFGDPFNARILVGAILVLGSGAYMSLIGSAMCPEE